MGYPTSKIIIDEKDPQFIKTPPYGSSQLFLQNGVLSSKKADGTLNAIGNEWAASSSSAPEVFVAGDSRAANGFSIPANVAQGYKTAGFTTWLRQITRQRFNLPLTNNFSVGGTSTYDLVNTQLPQILASSAKVGFVISSTNDRTAVSPAISYDETITNLNKVITSVTAVGKAIIIIAELPRGSAGGSRLTGTALKDHLRVHRWIQKQAYRPLVTVVDAFTDWSADPLDAALIDVNTTLAPDNLHPGGRGAHDLALRIKPIIEAMFTPVDILPINNADLYHITDNPTGSLNSNPMMAGTGGTLQAPSSGTLTGTVANTSRVRIGNGSNNDSSTGLTVAASVVTVNGKRWQQFAISGTPTQAAPWVQIDTFGFTATAGWEIEAVAEYEVDTSQTGLSAIELQLAQPSGAKIYVDGQGLTATADFPVVAVPGVLKTQSFVVDQTGSTTGFVKVSLLQNVAVSATVRVRALSVRKTV